MPEGIGSCSLLKPAQCKAQSVWPKFGDKFCTQVRLTTHLRPRRKLFPCPGKNEFFPLLRKNSLILERHSWVSVKKIPTASEVLVSGYIFMLSFSLEVVLALPQILCIYCKIRSVLVVCAVPGRCNRDSLCILLVYTSTHCCLNLQRSWLINKLSLLN